ncbi:MAG: Lipopolysaccharide heptosyltransferase 1 [Planctomycetes bacterium]|nr:Lipopolysaccharide heptosyltransferase 1 [Planctomycetota bacterium]
MPPEPPRRVLLVRLSALGDVVHALPALASLRAAMPHAEIGWLVEDRHAGVLEGHPQIDRLFTFRRRGGIGAVLEARRTVRAWRPDAAIDLQGNLKSGVLARLSGAPRRIGLPPGEAREGAHRFVNERVPAGPAGEHRSARALRLVRALAPGAPDAAPVLPPVRPESDEAMRAELARRGIGRFAVLVSGTSDFGAFKRWPPERFGAFARRLRDERGLAPLVSFGPGQRDLAERIVAASDGAAELTPETRSLADLVALLRGADLVVGADSGPVAIAAAAGVRTVALFGPKDPAVYAPPGRRVAVVWKQVYCSPCRLRVCDDPICMTTMTPDEAWAGVLRAEAAP